MGVNSLPKTVTRQRRDCDLNPGPSAPESSTLSTRLPSHPFVYLLILQSALAKCSRGVSVAAAVSTCHHVVMGKHDVIHKPEVHNISQRHRQRRTEPRP